MTNPNQAAVANEGPEGSIFLPKNRIELTAREIDNIRLEIMLGRGRAAAMSPQEQERAYADVERFILSRQKIAAGMAGVAIAPGI